MLNKLVPSDSQTNIIRTRGGKKVGDPVLDAPISFTVEVELWQDATGYTGDTEM